MEIQEPCRVLQIPHSSKDRWIDAQDATRTKPMSLGSTELSRLVAATAGQISGTTLQSPTTQQSPTTGYHTASETASLSSVRAALRLLGCYKS